MKDLSILIPARNEEFISKTVKDILSNIEGNTEVIVVLDGEWADPGIEDDKRVRIIKLSQSIGQRAATNLACKLSQAKYIMKCDAHCAFDKGFDVKMIQAFEDLPDGDCVTMVPIMRNLHAFDWVCENGHRRYQSPSGPCNECGKETKKDVVWIAKQSPQSTAYCFDPTLHFQYFGELKKRQQGDLVESMSLQGSCWMLTREKYWQLNICDEKHGSWGQQGVEVACKTWLSGGKVICNKRTWYAHMFRTQGKDFSFPFPLSQTEVEKAREYSKNLWFNNQYEYQIYPLSWLVEKFWPVYMWTEEDLQKIKKLGENFNSYREPTKGIIYYTHNQLNLKIAHAVQDNLRKISKEKNIPIVSASLKKMRHFGDKNIYFPHLKKGYLAMFKQILGALQNSTADIIFMAEHDVIYPPSHFDFIPPKKDIFYYNQNWWRVRLSDGFAVHWDANQVSGLCAYRELLIKFYEERVAIVEKEGYNRRIGFEPGGRYSTKTEAWKSKEPYLDIKHGNNLSKDKWSPDDFRDKSACVNWQEGYEIPFWGKTESIVKNLK